VANWPDGPFEASSANHNSVWRNLDTLVKRIPSRLLPSSAQLTGATLWNGPYLIEESGT